MQASEKLSRIIYYRLKTEGTDVSSIERTVRAMG
jgi:hypothetical protein